MNQNETTGSEGIAPEIITDVQIPLRSAIDTDNAERVDELLSPLPFNDVLREVLELPQDMRGKAMAMMQTTLAASIVEEAPAEVAALLMEGMAAKDAAEIIDELDSDVQADVIGEMEQAAATAVLEQMDEEDASDVRRLVEYEDDTAGGLMLAEVFSFSQNETVGAVLRRLASDEEDFEHFRGQHPYMLDDEGRPVGVVSLRGLLTSRRVVKLSEVMGTPLTVSVDADLDELEDIFDKYDFLGMPVVDAEGKLAGFVSREAVDDALNERAESQSLHRQGIFGDEIRSMPLLVRSRRRLGWLSANIVLNIMAASVISAYEETLTAVIAIAIFLPMVSDMSGCSGNQAVGVTLRELSLGIVRPIDAAKVWMKEVSVGVINGIALGILIGIVAWVWKGNPWLGLVIGLALSLNTIIAVSIGGVVPLLLKRFGQDPAVASGPLLTTITDMAGFFLVLSLATMMMPLLVG